MRDEDADPIFRLLRSARDGIITANTASNKGDLFEVLVGWHIMRQVIMEKPPTLEKTLRSLLPANFIFPEVACKMFQYDCDVRRVDTAGARTALQMYHPFAASMCTRMKNEGAARRDIIFRGQSARYR
jgi:hypothetical protein